MRYAEFCAGVGGFRLGLESSGADVQLVYSNEIDCHCEKTYESNFNQKFDSKDIFSVDATLIPDFDMLCAGFPCQPFSVAGKELGFADSRGTVFFKLLEIIKIKKPGIVFLENVPNLVHHRGGFTYKAIIDSLSEANYALSPIILDSSYFGVPQSRSRIYIIGLNKKIYGEIKVNYTQKRTEKTALRSFLCEGDYSIPITPRWQEYIDYYTGRRSAHELSFELPRTRKKLERVADNCDLFDCIFQVRSSGVRALSLDNPLPTFTVLNSGGGAHIPILSKERRHLYPALFFFSHNQSPPAKRV